MLVNGTPGNTIHAEDRGLAYGDGVFRTLRLREGQPVGWERQYAKLRHDCDALKIPCPSAMLLSAELQQLGHAQADGIAKIILTRGVAPRGYAPPARAETTRILSVTPSTSYPPEYHSEGICLHVCRLSLSHQPLLAGIKHLNRLENVLAAGEWSDPHIPEGLLSDIAGHVISGTRSNLFMFRDDILYTPDLSRCGVAGVQRDRVMSWAQQHGVDCRVTDIRMQELLAADEIFLVNSVFSLWPVRKLAGYHRTRHPKAWQIQEWLKIENH